MQNRLRLAEARLLPLRMAANSIELRRRSLIRDPDQKLLDAKRIRNSAEDQARAPFAFPKRKDLFKSRDERQAMNEAYCRLMIPFTYERREVRARASRHFESWIARYSRPRMTAQDIVRWCAEAGALEP